MPPFSRAGVPRGWRGGKSEQDGPQVPAHEDGKECTMKPKARLLLSLAAVALLARTPSPARADEARDAASKDASEATRRYFEETTGSLAWEDREDEALATRGLVATIPSREIRDAQGNLVRDLHDTDILEGERPATVNPSLWRNARLLANAGLFKVTDRVYQVRGIELANLTVVLGDKGNVVIDTLTTVEAARAAMQLVRDTLGDRPVTGVIYTHSHIDHFGGAAGVISPEEAKARAIPIVAPKHFYQEAVSENVIAGPAMSRRTMYAFGHLIGVGPRADISDGIGPAFNRLRPGTNRMLRPTLEIGEAADDGKPLTIDGIDFEFLYLPGTEAPAEMAIYMPQLRVLDMAEVANGSLHNILTLRGAQVRDAKSWADGLTHALRRFGSRTDTLITSHFWPRWGNAKILDFLSSQRDTYKYLHDQSVRMMNDGQNGQEIAEALALPPALGQRWFNQGYYGTLSHNSKAVYQRYLGWYDGNPAHLNPLPPEASGRKHVEAMGGAQAVLSKGREAMAAGDYRWASELLSYLVFAEPDNEAARFALADSLEQQGYQATSSQWRNQFLSGARELREGIRTGQFDSLAGTIPNLPLSDILDLMAVRLVPDRALASPMAFNLKLTDETEAETGEQISIRNGVLVHQPLGSDLPQAPLLQLTRAQFVAAITHRPVPGEVPEAEQKLLTRFTSLFKAPSGNFGLVTPGP